MNEKKNNPGKIQKGPEGTEHQNDELDIGNDLSVGSGNDTHISDFDPNKDYSKTEKKEHQHEASDGDDQRSDDNGINPGPGEFDPQKRALNNDLNVENDDDDEKDNSTSMISGRNRKI